MKVRTKVALATASLIVLAFFAVLFTTYRCERPYTANDTPIMAELRTDRLSAIDEILKSMEFGNIAFNAPSSMNLFDTTMIQLLLAVGTPIDELKQRVEAEGERVGAHIRVSDRMEARLSGQNFAITGIVPEVQAVSRDDVTEWKWEIKPKAHGRQFLHLTLSALISVDGETTPRAIRTFDRVIEVEVTLGQRVGAFVKENWQWLWAVILVPLAGWLWKKRERLFKPLDSS